MPQEWHTDMLRIPCPHCGPRDEVEFRHAGSGVPLPGHATDEEWARVLYLRDTPLGPLTEQWVHVYGCRQWLHVVRDTRTHAILETRPVSAPPADPTS